MVYKLRLTEGELSSLAWVSARYESARVLYDAIESDEDPIEGDPSAVRTWTLSEPDAWEYCEALRNEDGPAGEGQLIPPCIGGELADKLLALWSAIV